MEGGSPNGAENREGQIYRPLKNTEIRVLEILPGAEGSTVETRLKYIDLGTSGYFALSYAWGDPNAPKFTLHVDGYPFQVTENCMLALNELRRESMACSRTYSIWIDAICINQTDIPERTHQLYIMRKIYAGATKLIIWLGPERDGSNEAIEIMKELVKARSQGGFEDWRERFENHEQYLRRWQLISSFLCRSWFTRVWIIQEYLACSKTEGRELEILASKAIEFYCGASRVSPVVLYELIYHGANMFLQLPKVDATTQEQMWPLLTSSRRGSECFYDILLRAFNPIHLSQKLAAFQLLGHIVHGLACDATDPRDRVYAHLPLQLGWTKFMFDRDSVQKQSNKSGLSYDACLEDLAQNIARTSFSLSKLIVDYSRSVEDVYSSLVRYIEFATGSLNILSLCHKRGAYIKRTWTLDLTAIPYEDDGYRQEGGLLTRSILEARYQRPAAHKSFSASNGAVADAHFSLDLSVLSVRGFRTGTIVSSLDSDFWPILRLTKLLWSQIVVSMMTWMRAYETHELRQKALWNTMLGAKSYEDEPELFRKWCSWLDSDAEILEMWDEIVLYQPDRRIFTASNGKIGKGWNTIKRGDLICVILGCDVPLVLRPVGDQYELIGDCYMDGIMEGQAMKDVEEGRIEWETFDLR